MTTVDDHWDTNQCCCPMCMSGLADEAQDTDFTLDPSADASGDYDKPIWSAYQTAQHLARQGSTWADNGNIVNGKTEVTYRFYDGESAGDPNHEFEDINKANTRKILDQYAEVANLVFTEVTDQAGSANINFKYRDGENGGGYWNGTNVVVSRVGWEPEMEAGTYNQRLMLHEIGHAMGLNHPGNYNGTGFNYGDHAEYWNDSHQYSNMSYWSEGNTGAAFGNMSTLALHDILAIQIEYGVNMTTRTGDDTYGYNATTGDAYDFNSTRTNGSGNERSNKDMAFSIWDAGGHDTIDFSGSNVGTELDLREGAFSSANGMTYNVSIAYGAVIENGVGSDHDDLIRGNAANNTLMGGKGDDTLIGGAEQIDLSPNPRAFTGISLNEDPTQFDQRLQVEDFTGFSGGAFTIDMMVDITRMSSSETTFVSYATQSNADTFLIQGRPDSVLRIEINGFIIDTDIETLSLIDGQAHRLSVGWDSATGALSVHIDGEPAWTGTHQAGASIASGGTLVFGQDQDTVGGWFNDRQTFQGTMGDIRVFGSHRTDGAIAQDPFSAPASEAPIHHWSVTPQTNGSISDGGTGSNMDLTIINDGTVLTVGETAAPIDADTLFGGEGQDTLYGGFGADRLNGETGQDMLYGGRGNDFLNGGDGADIIYGGDGDDTVLFSAGPDQNYGGAGRNTISGGASGTVLTAGTVIDLAQSTQTLGGVNTGTWQGFHNFNNANLTGVLGTGETVRGTAANNVIRTGSNDNMLFGNGGADTLDGAGGNDMLYGGDGNDHAYGGRGNDEVRLGNGNDSVWAGGGAEKFYGGAGQDFISYYDSTGGVTLNLAKNTAKGSWASNDVVHGFEDVNGSQTGADDIIGTSGANHIRTFGGNDKVQAGAGTDRVDLGAGNDFVHVGKGKGHFDGGSGRDHISYADSTKGIRIDLRDDKVGGSWADNDTIKDFESATGSKTGGDRMFGSNAVNILHGKGGADLIEGRDGNDRLYGGGGADKLHGGRGADMLDGGGGSGKDLLFGGKGADQFRFARGEGMDVVKDFQNNVDTIALDNFKFKARDAFDFAKQVGSDVIFDFGRGGTLKIDDISIGKLQDDLIIV